MYVNTMKLPVSLMGMSVPPVQTRRLFGPVAESLVMNVLVLP